MARQYITLEVAVHDLLNKGQEKVAEEQAERDADRAICEDYAATVWTMYNAFMKVGFRKKQAFELVLMMVADNNAK